MNPTSQKPTLVQVIAVVGAVAIAGILAFALMWCAIWKIDIDKSLLMAISTILGGIAGAITTILVGRSISQLNQPDDAPPNNTNRTNQNEKTNP